MATYKVLYWQEVPSQIKAEDDADDVTLQIEVWPGQKTVKVPFELKDVKLP